MLTLYTKSMLMCSKKFQLVTVKLLKHIFLFISTMNPTKFQNSFRNLCSQKRNNQSNFFLALCIKNVISSKKKISNSSWFHNAPFNLSLDMTATNIPEMRYSVARHWALPPSSMSHRIINPGGVRRGPMHHPVCL